MLNKSKIRTENDKKEKRTDPLNNRKWRENDAFSLLKETFSKPGLLKYTTFFSIKFCSFLA